MSESAQHRGHLPQLDGGLFLTDGGFETTVVFHKGWDLPMFEAFVLLESEEGRQLIKGYYDDYLPIAADHNAGFILESATWRASPDWGEKTGHSRDEIAALNKAAIDLLVEVRDANRSRIAPIVISGCIGPRGDGYDPGDLMTAKDAKHYHSFQVSAFRDTPADVVTAMTMTNAAEAAGIVMAAQEISMPSIVSFTLETDGRLPTGEPLSEAIQFVDAETANGPEYYMINCAHPTHFQNVLYEGADWMSRIKGIRANSSKCSHEELDNATELDIGNPAELGSDYAGLLQRFPHINVLGGCCGTDHRHIRSIGQACFAA